MKTLTKKQTRALQIVALQPMSASRFARDYFIEPQYEYLFTAESNQGNGACAGKKAWLAAGSLLAKLEKKGLVRHFIRQSGRIGPRGRIAYISGYEITSLGRRLLEESAYKEEQLLVLKRNVKCMPHLQNRIDELQNSAKQ